MQNNYNISLNLICKRNVLKIIYLFNITGYYPDKKKNHHDTFSVALEVFVINY